MKTPRHIPREAFSLREAAQVMGVSERHMAALCARGIVYSVKLGARRVVPKRTIAELLEGPTQPARPARGQTHIP